jgi:hypothetical protein
VGDLEDATDGFGGRIFVIVRVDGEQFEDDLPGV